MAFGNTNGNWSVTQFLRYSFVRLLTVFTLVFYRANSINIVSEHHWNLDWNYSLWKYIPFNELFDTMTYKDKTGWNSAFLFRITRICQAYWWGRDITLQYICFQCNQAKAFSLTTKVKHKTGHFSKLRDSLQRTGNKEWLTKTCG